MANIGSAYLTIFPTMDGFGSKLTSELNGVNVTSIGGKLGKQLSGGMSSGLDSGSASAGLFSGKLSALAGVAGGVAGELAGRLFDSVMGLSGEMVAAADSSQKFAQTLDFAGIDSSTIEQLTASTQAYADQTVYDLADIRNVTAQLAANGVDNYAQLAEAAGNLNAVAGGNSDTFRSVSMVMSQTAGQGKLVTENWNQLTDAIPGASGALEQAMRDAGAFEGNFRDAMANGEISADEFFAAVQKLGMQDVAVEAATSTSTIEGALGNLQASVVNVGAQAVTALTPLATGIMSELGNAIMQLPAVLQTMAPYFQAAFQPLVTAAQTMWTTLSPLFAQLGAAIIPLIQQVGVVATPILQSISAYVGNFITIFTTMWAVLAPILTQIVTFVTTQVLPIVQPAIQSVANVVQATFPVIQAVISAAMNVIQAVWNRVWPVLQAVAVPILQTVSSVVSGVMGTIEGIITAVMQVINGDWRGAWNTMKSTISGAISGIVGFVKSIPDKILSALGSLGGLLKGAGEDLINGLKEGITGAIDGVVSAVKNGVENVVNAAKGLLGIASPSKVFAEIGDFTMQGLAKGIAGGESAPGKARGSALDDVEGAFAYDGAPGMSCAYAASASPASSSLQGGSVLGVLDEMAGAVVDIRDMLPSALDPATRARFARGAVAYAH